jgi:glycosyltransferase involved in cell wall biosynthesis
VSREPLVSVILIFLNAERFIHEAIESVLAQSYGNWELVFVDDGSTDSSGERARQYSSKYTERMRYLQHPGGVNRGMSASRNLGIKNASGEYIAFIDADDVWMPEKLEHQVQILNSRPEAAMICGATLYWYSWTGKQQDLGKDYVLDLSLPPDTLINPPALLPTLLRNPVVTSTGGLIRREIIEEVNGFEESFPALFEDQVFCAKVCLTAPVFVSDRCWYKYRIHSDSCCSVAISNGRYHSDRLFFLNWLNSYLSERKVMDEGIWRSLKRERWKCRFPTLSRISDHSRYRASIMKELARSSARRILPPALYAWLKRKWRGPAHSPQVGAVRFGDLRRLTPISREFGYDRGTPVDRYYIEDFLARHALDIRGNVLEVGDDSYTRKYGRDRVSRTDVVHVSEGNPKATIVADLAHADHIPSDCFDCIILTQTLHLIHDAHSALSTLTRVLKPNGVLLATFPGISQIDHYDWGKSWHWGFTSLSARKLFSDFFPEANLHVETHGNVLAAIAFLHGIAWEELRADELDYNDPDYQVTIAVRAKKSAE